MADKNSTKGNSTFLGALLNSAGNILSVLSGLISFPIFTRLLSANDYGLMSLLNTTIFLSVGCSKCGIQQAMLRLWKTDPEADTVLYSTAMYGVLLISLPTVAVTLLILHYSVPTVDESLGLVAMVGAIMLMDPLRSVTWIKELAQGHNVRYNVAYVGHKYLNIIVAIAMLLLLGNGIYGVIYGFYAASACMLAWMYFSDHDIRASFASFDRKIYREMVAFGFPLLIVEVIGQAVDFSDRYFIAYFVDIESVGVYSAAYNFIFNIEAITISGFTVTISQVIVREYDKGGNQAVLDFLDLSMKLYFCVGSAAAVGLIMVGPDMFILLASPRYEEALNLFNPIILGYFMFGIYSIAAYKLFIHKRTVLSASFISVAAMVSISANMALLPKIGVMGAALSTFIAYSVLAIIGFWLMWGGRFVLKLLLLMPYFIPTAVMYGVLMVMPETRDWLSIACRVAIGSLVWVVVAGVGFREVREPIFRLVMEKVVARRQKSL